MWAFQKVKHLPFRPACLWNLVDKTSSNNSVTNHEVFYMYVKPKATIFIECKTNVNLFFFLFFFMILIISWESKRKKWGCGIELHVESIKWMGGEDLT
jgi:hypothetical protein